VIEVTAKVALETSERKKSQGQGDKVKGLLCIVTGKCGPGQLLLGEKEKTIS